jgi:(5-formylfuran-3-yl)methyl phosphate synthase
MTTLKLSNEKPGLLVSVRNAAEALAALAGGADVIDVKEPKNGSLGAADDGTISAVVAAVNGRAPVSAAFGELVDLLGLKNGNCRRVLVDGVSLFKIGLAECRALDDWQTRWHHAVDSLVSTASMRNAQAVAVVYADWRAAQSPSPHDVLSAAIQRRCPALLIDTWDKSAGTLFDHWPAGDLETYIAEVRSHNLSLVLAGSLTGENVTAAARLAPDLIAVRTAACEGGRTGRVSERKVRELKIAIATSMRNMAVSRIR